LSSVRDMMKAHMDDLPTSPPSGGNIPISQSDQSDQSKKGDGSQPPGTSGITKELESGGPPQSEQLRPAMPEIELPKEVARAGVKVQPTTVPIPQNVAQLGMKPAGQNIPPTQTQTVAMPLTEQEIAQGLQKSIVSSWRWLAEWCIRRLKQMHGGLKTIHGKLTKKSI
jgi:hypothetical protein